MLLPHGMCWREAWPHLTHSHQQVFALYRPLPFPVRQERLALAEEEYARGLSKLRGAASELRSLASRVQSTQRSGKGEPRGRPGLS